jgi:hypothetical protein
MCIDFAASQAGATNALSDYDIETVFNKKGGKLESDYP